MHKATDVVYEDLSEQLVTRFLSVPRVAWDIETSGLNPRIDRIGTVQLYAPEAGTIIIQISDRRPDHLITLLSDSQTLKVFHHAMFDLRFMFAKWGAISQKVTCTKIASKILQPDRQAPFHSLQHLLLEYLNIEISKEFQLSNWFAKELSREQINYARNDVQFLLPLLDALQEKLESEGLSALFSACTDFIPARVQLELGRWQDVFTY
ncbi:ribonuclease D [Nonomuraea sp. NPDC050202]|jgi:ribonuclease D|uniref:ribonuclease D n=1 Tax=Nonomuraea sp. NPDC050202 TaxID=3155035 RepID=UPI0033C84EED